MVNSDFAHSCKLQDFELLLLYKLALLAPWFPIGFRAKLLHVNILSFSANALFSLTVLCFLYLKVQCQLPTLSCFLHHIAALRRFSGFFWVTF